MVPELQVVPVEKFHLSPSWIELTRKKRLNVCSFIESVSFHKPWPWSPDCWGWRENFCSRPDTRWRWDKTFLFIFLLILKISLYSFLSLPVWQIWKTKTGQTKTKVEKIHTIELIRAKNINIVLIKIHNLALYF